MAKLTCTLRGLTSHIEYLQRRIGFLKEIILIAFAFLWKVLLSDRNLATPLDISYCITPRIHDIRRKKTIILP